MRRSVLRDIGRGWLSCPTRMNAGFNGGLSPHLEPKSFFLYYRPHSLRNYLWRSMLRQSFCSNPLTVQVDVFKRHSRRRCVLEQQVAVGRVDIIGRHPRFSARHPTVVSIVSVVDFAPTATIDTGQI